MLDKIMEMVGGQALESITSKAGISMDQAKQMLPLAQDSLQDGLMSQITGGNVDNLIGMFNSAGGDGLMNNPIFSGIKSMFMKKIMTSIGLPESVAGLAAGSGMGSIIGSISGLLKQDGDNDDINVSNIMNVLGGGGAAGVLGSLLGGGGEGGVMDNIADVAGDLLGGGDTQKKKGGIGGFLGKLFGK